MINVDIFKRVFPACKNPEEICNLLDNILPAAGIDTKNRIAGFLAQCGHESGGFSIMCENLNYSAKGLLGVFPKYFNAQTAAEYERKPEKIANKVYANRMGNGDESSGDGFKYRGSGVIQLTGKDNFKAFGDSVGEDLVSNPDRLRTDATLAIKSAIWFWNKNNLNKYCDNDDITGMTKKINGGINGLEERKKHYEAFKNA